MSTSFKGKLEKLTWKDVRAEVAKVNPAFAKVIDELNPDDKHWIAKVTYPYGSLVLERSILQLPNKHGDLVPITDSSLDPEIRAGLEYNLHSNPVSLVLKNTFEIFLPIQNRTIPMDGLIHEGAAFGAWRILGPEKSQQPIFIWDMSAGARSVFMMPKITENKKHLKLKKAFDLAVDAPQNLMGHWEIFRQIANHSRFDQQWDAEILYFPIQWFQHLQDKKWQNFYYFFHGSIFHNSEFWRNQGVWNVIFSVILNEYEARPSGYIMDTAKYLLHIGINAVCGLGPAIDNSAGPIAGLQKVYNEIYDLKHYPPIIIQPHRFDIYNPNARPVYYALQFPNALEFKPNSRLRTSIITDLHEIRSLMLRYSKEFLSNKFKIDGTPFYDLFNYTQYDYFHHHVELHSGMRNSTEMPAEDPNLLRTVDGVTHKTFPESSAFVTGCIRLSHKNKLKINS